MLCLFCRLALTALLVIPAYARAATPQEIAVAAYHRFDEQPELGKQEKLTRDYIIARIAEIGGLRVQPLPSLPTAVIAVLDTGKPGPTIALRADMDARRLDAGTNEPASHVPRSLVPGLMHNCGHDAHSAMLLGALAQIARRRSEYRGAIVFVFQPAEEVSGGADDIVASGILKRLGVQAIFAQHAAPGLPVGKVSLGLGTPLAGSTTFSLILTGRPAHAAAPFEGSDLAVTAARFIDALATMPARGWDIANRPAIVSVTRVNTASGPVNNTPGSITLEGTIRAFEPLDRAPAGAQPLREIIAERIASLAAHYRVTADLKLTPGAPPTRNSDALTAALVPLLARESAFRVTTTPDRGMFAEDFAFYTVTIPALYFGLGVARGGLGNDPVHTPEFTIHPAALEIGVHFLATLARTATRELPLGVGDR